jgi:hypothetical protein
VDDVRSAFFGSVGDFGNVLRRVVTSGYNKAQVAKHAYHATVTTKYVSSLKCTLSGDEARAKVTEIEELGVAIELAADDRLGPDQCCRFRRDLEALGLWAADGFCSNVQSRVQAIMMGVHLQDCCLPCSDTTRKGHRLYANVLVCRASGAPYSHIAVQTKDRQQALLPLRRAPVFVKMASLLGEENEFADMVDEIWTAMEDYMVSEVYYRYTSTDDNISRALNDVYKSALGLYRPTSTLAYTR